MAGRVTERLQQAKRLQFLKDVQYLFFGYRLKCYSK